MTETGLAATIHVLRRRGGERPLTVDGLAGADRFTLNGTAGADSLGLAGDATGIVATGLPAIVASRTPRRPTRCRRSPRRRRRDLGRRAAAQPARLTIDGGDGGDTLGGTQGDRHAPRRRRERLRRRQPRQRHRVHGRRRRHVPVGSRRRQRHGRGPGRHTTRCCSTARTSPRRSTCRRTAAGCGSPATSRNITMDTDGVETGRLQRPRRRRHGHGATTSTGTDVSTVEPRPRRGRRRRPTR